MQSLLLPSIPSPYTSFGKHRFNSDLSNFSLNLSPSNSRSGRSGPGSPYLSPPMSGSPPPVDPLPSPETQGHGHRTQSPPREPTVSTFTSYIQGSPQIRVAQEQETFEDRNDSRRRSAPYEFGQRAGIIASEGALVEPAAASQQAYPSLQRSYSERVPPTTRRTKAHVQSACVNCKKKHLRCDSQRPCRRCVQSGKEDSCRDVVHKKRGRPPLTPHEGATKIPTTARTQSQGTPLQISAGLDQPDQRYRELRPGIGAQSPARTDLGPAGYGSRFSAYQYSAASASPSSTITTSSPTYSFASGASRPFSAGRTVQESQYYPTPYMTSSTGFIPMETPRSYPQPYTPQTQPTSYPPFSAPQPPQAPTFLPSTQSSPQTSVPGPPIPPPPRFPGEFSGPQLAPMYSGAVEQAQRQAQRLSPEAFHDSPRSRQRGSQYPTEQSAATTRPREEEEGEEEGRSSKRRRMNIGEILER